MVCISSNVASTCFSCGLVLSLLAFVGNVRAQSELEKLAFYAVQEATELLDEIEAASTVNSTGTNRGKGGRWNSLSREWDTKQNLYDEAVTILNDRYLIPPDVAHSLIWPLAKNLCSKPRTRCAPSRYRSIDGSCNNRVQPWWGQAGTAQDRLLRPAYEGRNAPRGGFQSTLPNPRFISTRLHYDINVEYPGITNLVPAFGQFLDHDITLTPEGDRRCCAGAADTNCWPIAIPADDPFYASRGRTCLDFTRSTACTDLSGVRQQMNMNTAFIDASQVYGSTDERAQQLRSGRGGKLVTNENYPDITLPFASQRAFEGNSVQGDFISGDDRLNETPMLTIMHNLFFREHNRLAGLISIKRPHWDDERIFQEARRIMIAEMQVIVYKEFLPVILGPATVHAYGLELPPVGQQTIYDPTMNPTIINGFTAAAYRFGHTLVNNFLLMINSKTQEVVGSFNLKDEYFESDTLVAEGSRGTDYITTALLQTQAQNYDPFFAQGLTNFLFRERGQNFGQDLVTRNLQRARDHGVPGYNAWRRFCGLPPLSFHSPPANIPKDAWRRLRNVYRHPDDVDFYSGGLHEEPANGGTSGLTFQCVMAIQFERLKYGDRYFVTHWNQEGSFSPAQIQAISRRRISDVICNNGIQPFVQDNAFLTPSENNPQIYCSDQSRDLDIELFLGH